VFYCLVAVVEVVAILKSHSRCVVVQVDGESWVAGWLGKVMFAITRPQGLVPGEDGDGSHSCANEP
jgi:hypothetical protein